MSDDPTDGEESADRSDPFERLDADADREGDPFERLGSGDERADGDSSAPVDDEPWVPPDADDRGSEIDDDPSGPTTTDAESDDPFADVDAPTQSPFEDAGSVFERVDAGAVDPDQVWESITAEDDDAEPGVPAEGRYSDVSKHRFCEGCEHFSPPPNASCGHHTAEIIEFLDMDTVRLLDCPVVAEREALERRD